MLIFTLWACDGTDMPWLVDAVDEYTLEENGGVVEGFEEKRKNPANRQLIIEVPDRAVQKLWESPIVEGKVK